MNNIISRYSIITLSIFTSTFSQQERLMWEDLVDKKGIKYSSGSKKPFTGRVFDNYKNKGRKLTGSFKNGKMNGNWTFWKEDGKIDREEAYLLGEKNGEWTFYDDNGKKLKSERYSKGKKTGSSSLYHPNGQKSKEETYVNDKREGKWTSWYSNGKREKVEFYKKGKKVNKWNYYNEDGKLESTVSYKNDIKDGKSMYVITGEWSGEFKNIEDKNSEPM